LKRNLCGVVCVPLSERRVAWLLDEVEQWMEARVNAARHGK
jgi:predicted DNA-binding transcriptional regulator AlpA